MKELLYVLLGLTIPFIGIFIYEKAAKPISSYLVDGMIKVENEEYENTYNENQKLMEEVKKLKTIRKVKGDKE